MELFKKMAERRKIRQEEKRRKKEEIDNFAKTILLKLENMDKSKLKKIYSGYSYDDAVFVQKFSDDYSGSWSELKIGQYTREYCSLNEEIYILCEKKYNELIEEKVNNLVNSL
jgi:uncharacterized protein YjaZ